MEGSFSPVVKKIAGEVVGKRKRTSQVPTDVCLEDWWLSKLNGVEGIAVSGRPVEMRRYDNARRDYDSAPTKRRYASREFHSTEVVKRHSCTTVETSDGLFVFLCGFINRSRTQENGFSSEVCRDFIYGFPFNWKDYAGEKSSQSNRNHFAETILPGLPASLDAYNGAQLHDMVLSLTDNEREILNKKMYDNLMAMLNPETTSGKSTELSSNPNPSFVKDEIPLTPISSKPNTRNRRQLQMSAPNYNVQGKVVGSTTTSKRRVCRTPEKPVIEESANISPVKQSLEGRSGKKSQTSRKRTRASVSKDPESSTKGSVKDVVYESTRVVRTSRERACKRLTSPKAKSSG